MFDGTLEKVQFVEESLADGATETTWIVKERDGRKVRTARDYYLPSKAEAIRRYLAEIEAAVPSVEKQVQTAVERQLWLAKEVTRVRNLLDQAGRQAVYVYTVLHHRVHCARLDDPAKMIENAVETARAELQREIIRMRNRGVQIDFADAYSSYMIDGGGSVENEDGSRDRTYVDGCDLLAQLVYAVEHSDEPCVYYDDRILTWTQFREEVGLQEVKLNRLEVPKT
jgi:hypothetical protein